MVEIEIRRRPKPGPGPALEGTLPTRASDGTGWIVGCPKCNRSRVVGRAAVMSGRWMTCPFCEGGTDDDRS